MVYPNNPWKYQVINPSKKLDQNSWLQGYGTIGEGIDTLIKHEEDTLVCITNFDAGNLLFLKSLQIKIRYESNCIISINGSKPDAKEYSLNNLDDIKAQYDSVDSIRSGYLNAIYFEKRYSKATFNSHLHRKNNTLELKFYHYRNSGKDIKPYIVLREKKNYERIVKNDSYKDFRTSELPIIKINTNGKPIHDNSNITARMGIINNTTRKNNIKGPFNEYDGLIKIKTRGFTSRMFPKKSFNITTIDDDGTTKINTSLLGMPIENEWILYASYNDRSMLRNALIFKLSNEIGLYAPRTKYCELFINDEYQGIYVLIEKIKQDNNRVNIHKMKSTDTSYSEITGGYIMSIERDGNWHSPFHDPRTTGIIIYEYKDPKIGKMNPNQVSYIGNYLKDFESSFYYSTNKASDTSYLNYIDESSFVDFYILNELARNVDGLRLSTYFNKDRTGKLNIGPIWDFDLSFGLPYYSRGYWFQGSILDNNSCLPFWWYELLQKKHFKNSVSKRWEELRKSKLEINNIYKSINELTEIISEAQERNFEKWGTLNYNVWPNYYNENSYLEQVDYIRFWTEQRIGWLDIYFRNFTKQTDYIQ